MKYKNAAEVLPPELIGQIQEYIQGAFLYIPKKEKQAHRAVTEYRLELDKRNLRIYKMHLEGMTNGQLAQNFSLAQSSIRRILIGQRKSYEMMCGKIQSLLWQWNLQQQRITQIHPSVWQIGEDHVLKVYDQPESLNRNIMINTHLERMGIPVGRLIPTVEGADYAADGDVYYLVSEKLPGSNLISLKFGGKTAEAMGSIIARLHLAFESLEEQVSLWDNSLLDEMNGWVRERFEETGFAHISREDFDLVVRNLASSYEKLPFGLIHRDVHFGNFLFHNKKFSGYIDFDLTQRNIRVFDLRYFSLSVLSEKEKFEITPENWFDFTRNVFAGYHKLVELTRQEKESAVYVMECIELLFLAYFEGQEDTLQAQSPWFFDTSFERWKASFEADVDGEGRPLFRQLHVKAAYEADTLLGFVQYGCTAFGFDEHGEISDAVSYPVVRNLYFVQDSPKAGQLLLNEAMEGLKGRGRLYAFFHYFGMSCFTREGITRSYYKDEAPQ